MADTRAVQHLSADAALRVVSAAHAHSRALGVPVNISVCDSAGNELAFLRPDGAALLSMGIARDKAYSVVAFNGLPTAAWFGLIKDEPALLHGIVHRDRLVIFAGGVPIRVGGVLVGAVGCSGGSAEEDGEIAQAGADAVG